MKEAMKKLSEYQYTTANGVRLHYRDEGEGPAILLVHGWPTSSFLYRQIVPVLAQSRRVIAIDLPGFGLSDKPLDRPYTFSFMEKTLEAFVQGLGIETLDLCVHDLGGPVGMYWACKHPDRIRSLAILNTLIYPQMSWAVKAFVLAARLPLIRDWLASKGGLRAAMRLGTVRKESQTEEMFAGAVAPFQTSDARQALLKAAVDFNPKGFFIIEKRLKEFRDRPVRVIYGARDKILPDIADTAERLKKDLPQTEITRIENAGHFLQEDAGPEVAEHMAKFLTAVDARKVPA